VQDISLNWGGIPHDAVALEYAKPLRSLRSLFETPTIEAIAKYIEAVSWVTLVRTLESKMGERRGGILTTVEFYLTCSSLDILALLMEIACAVMPLNVNTLVARRVS